MLLSRIFNFIRMSMKWIVISTKPLQARYLGSPPSGPRTLDSPINVHVEANRLQCAKDFGTIAALNVCESNVKVDLSKCFFLFCRSCPTSWSFNKALASCSAEWRTYLLNSMDIRMVDMPAITTDNRWKLTCSTLIHHIQCRVLDGKNKIFLG